MKTENLTLTKRIVFGRFIKMSMLSALLTLWYSGLQAQCPLACNNLVQVSMNETCVVEITPDMMLEGQETIEECDYTIQVLGTNGQPLASSPNITSANIGQTLTVRVWLGNNSCWGSIRIEDKLAPTINCPDPITVGCWENPTFGLPTANDNCGGNPVVRVLSDVTTDEGCGDFRARRVIRYQAQDASGNLSTVCERVIMYQAANFPSAIGFPKNYDGAVGQRPALECDGGWAWNANKTMANVPFPTNNWDVNGNGYPDPTETGAPFIRENNNISGYINGFIVTTSTPAGCVIGTLVTPSQQSQFAMLGCGLSSYRIDTFYNPIIGGNNTCKLNTTFSDTKIDICPKSFKVLRAWTVLDWCSGAILTRHQVIKVVDEEGPVVTCPQDITGSPLATVYNDPTGQGVAGVISTDPYTCSASWTVRAPITISDCNETTWTVLFKKEATVGVVPGDDVPWVSVDGDTRVTGSFPNFRIMNLPAGRTWVRYVVTDACGNVGFCNTEIDVIDRTPPIPVCDEFTRVTLSTNGRAIVFAESFDDGSHDNCSEVTFDVRRMTPGCGQSTTTWGPFVELCCDDVPRDVMVELRVTDAFGNSNVCMVTVRTDDKVPPVITCPASVTINCGADTSAVALGRPVFSATPISTPYFSDNCPNPRLSWRNSGTISDCGQGVITRTFTVTDNGGRTATCSQTITVRNSTPYAGPSRWPNSPVTVTGCMNADTEPSKTGIPTIGSGACSQVAYTYEDQVFPFVDNVCFKILRRWTVIDWCKFGPNTNPNGGVYPSAPVEGVNMWTFVQTIKVDDTEAPVIANRSKADTDAFGENCNGFVELTNSATDCTPANQLRWSYTIDPNNDGVGPFITGNTNSASGTYPVGTHRITWRVEDNCGNESTLNYTFRVLDKKKPTPYCISQLTTVVMPSSGMVEIWAKDFDHGSTDNCPVTGCGLRFTFNNFTPPNSNSEVLFNMAGTVVGSWPTTNVNLLARYASGELQRWLPTMCSSAKAYSCDDVGPNTENMSVWDASGNTDFCTVTLNVQANDACGGSRLAGEIGTINNEMVENVTVVLENTVSSETRVAMTNKDGQYDFYNVTNDADYMLLPEKDDDHLNGVSTLDLVLIQRHILGLQPLSNPYYHVAADINKDKRVTASDLVELRKLILGIYAKFPDNTSWRFFDKSTIVNDVNRVWTLGEMIYVDDMTNGALTNNFVAVKVGDVNASASVNANGSNIESRTSKSLTLNVNEKSYLSGETVKVDVTSENFNNIAGAQWTFNFDSQSMKFASVKSGALNLSMDNVNAALSNEGKLAFSWNEFNGVNVKSSEVLFSIEFEAITNNTISNTLSLSSDITKAEAYTNDLNVINLGLSYRNSSELEFALEQNNPNPFSANTTIAFTLPEAGDIKMTIFDVTGKVIKTVTGTYPKGNNEIALSSEDFNAQGVLFYELEALGHKAIKKMIFLNK